MDFLFKPVAGSGREERKERKRKRAIEKEKAAKVEKLKHAQFMQRLRERVFARDKGACRVCWKDLILDHSALLSLLAHLHHVKYRSAGGEDTTANTCILCRGCHKAEHESRIEITGNADAKLTLRTFDAHYQIQNVREI